VIANRLRGDRGMVTAELAMALPVLIIVLAAGLAAVTVVGQRVRAEDAAREAARAAARGDTAAAHRLVSQVAPGAFRVYLAVGRSDNRSGFPGCPSAGRVAVTHGRRYGGRCYRAGRR
jgi:hypothetical protein